MLPLLFFSCFNNKVTNIMLAKRRFSYDAQNQKETPQSLRFVTQVLRNTKNRKLFQPFSVDTDDTTSRANCDE